VGLLLTEGGILAGGVGLLLVEGERGGGGKTDICFFGRTKVTSTKVGHPLWMLLWGVRKTVCLGFSKYSRFVVQKTQRV
jgi:hypothetical protein